MQRYCFVIFLLLCVIACHVPTYNEYNRKSYQALLIRDYPQALAMLDKNKYLKKKHSTLLYMLEKGRLHLLCGHYEEAFHLLEQADNMLDSYNTIKQRDVRGSIHLKKTSTVFLGVPVVNESYYSELTGIFRKPRTKDYRPAIYERILIHYYKAICLLNLGRIEEAAVEARQLDLLSHNLDDYKSEEYGVTHYVSDPTPEMISGIVYELQPDINSAWISYDNALKKYQDQDAAYLFGNTAPLQLKKDVVKFSQMLGFYDRVNEYQKSFSLEQHSDTTSRYVILLIDQGLIPWKDDDYSWYHMSGGVISRGFDRKKNSIRFSKPVYTPSPLRQDPILKASTRIEGKPEVLYNPAYQTTAILNNRFDKETDHYLHEYLKNDTVVNNSSEYTHADTRNWQSVPSRIEYIKLPVDTGWNTILLKKSSGKIDTLMVRGDRRRNFAFLVN